MLIPFVICILWLRVGVSLLFLESNPSCATLSFLCVKSGVLHIPYYLQRCIPEQAAPFIYDLLDDTEIALTPSSHLSVQYQYNTFHRGRNTCPHVLFLPCSPSILQPSHSSFVLPLNSSSPITLSLLSSSHVPHTVLMDRRCVSSPLPTTTHSIASHCRQHPLTSSLLSSSSSSFSSSSAAPSSRLLSPS